MNEDLKMMQDNPKELFDKLVGMLGQGQPLSDVQKILFELLKKDHATGPIVVSVSAHAQGSGGIQA